MPLRQFGSARVQSEKRFRIVILALLTVSLAASAFCSTAQASAWELDPAATRITFSVKNLSVAYVTGTFRLASGRVVLENGDLSHGTIEAVIDAGSIDTDEPKRDAHLRSADFLDVARYPTIAFRSTRIEQVDGDHWKVTGNLTLRGTTRVGAQSCANLIASSLLRHVRLMVSKKKMPPGFITRAISPTTRSTSSTCSSTSQQQTTSNCAASNGSACALPSW